MFKLDVMQNIPNALISPCHMIDVCTGQASVICKLSERANKKQSLPCTLLCYKLEAEADETIDFAVRWKGSKIKTVRK